MKKFAILALAVLLVAAFTVPASALENEFGGYWRTRFYQMGHFDGEKGDATNYRLVDTRTRLYYTAKINDNLKLVNKFEMDATWGESQYVAPTTYDVVDAGGATIGTVTVKNPQKSLYGDPGADGIDVEIKNTYADFNTGPVNWTVGVQPYVLFRSFYIDNDASGAIARWKVLDNLVLAGSWLKAFEGGPGTGNNEDVDAYTLSGAFWFSENISIKPSISYTYSDSINQIYAQGLLAEDQVAGTVNTTVAAAPYGELSLLTYGFDFDADFDNFGLWATLIGQSGTLDGTGKDIDISSWLAAVGGNVMLGPVDIHGQAFYTPGDDNPNDRDLDNFVAVNGSYYWSEIMGYGIFDYAVSAGSPGDQLFNIWAVNLGATFKPMDKLSITGDLWYAEHEEDVVFNAGTALQRKENKLGTELDVKVTYQLVEGLNLDLVGAYLWAGDATSLDGKNNEDPYEFGARLSLSF
jgi:hypothetical protein